MKTKRYPRPTTGVWIGVVSALTLTLGFDLIPRVDGLDEFCGFPRTASAQDGIPSPEDSRIHPADALGSLFVTPSQPDIDVATRNVLTLRNADGEPLPGVPVVLKIESTSVCVCHDAVLEGVTQDDGTFEFVAAAGGYDGNPEAAIVYAGGEVIRRYAIKSPDNNGVSGDCLMNLADVVALTNCLQSTCIEEWDFDNDGEFGLGDIILYGRSFTSQQYCN